MEVEHAGAARKGPLSAWVRDVLVGVDPGHAPDVPEDALTGNEDAQLALWMTYELHYRGFDDVSPDAEWDLGILALRRQLERRFEEQLRAVTASAEVPLDTDVGEVLLDLAQSADGPSIALRLQRDATVDQMRDYLSQRSIVQLKEPTRIRSCSDAWTVRRRWRLPNCNTTSTAAAGLAGCTPRCMHRRCGPPGSIRSTARTSNRRRR